MYESSNFLLNQPVNLSSNDPTYKCVIQKTSMSINQSNIQSINHSANHLTIIQPTNQCVTQPVSQSTNKEFDSINQTINKKKMQNCTKLEFVTSLKPFIHPRCPCSCDHLHVHVAHKAI